MTEQGFGPAEARALLDSDFAPWVAGMGLEPLALGPARAEFRLPDSRALALRGGPGAGVTCGQALAAVADTACVLALSGANGRFRICTTTDLSISFLRPLRGAAAVSVEIESNGRRMAVCRVRIAAEGQDKAAALATASFLYPGEA
jgi:acyl-coenzyme A thioesterase PaaI-like protein